MSGLGPNHYVTFALFLMATLALGGNRTPPVNETTLLDAIEAARAPSPEVRTKDLSCLLRLTARGKDVNYEKGILIPVPIIPQANAHTCGLGAFGSQMALWGDVFREDRLIELLRPDRRLGTSQTEMVRLLDRLNDRSSKTELYEQYGMQLPKRFSKYSYRMHMNLVGYRCEELPYTGPGDPPFSRGLTLEGLKRYLRRQIPVLVLMQAWNSIPGYTTDDRWDGGHYVLVIGFDETDFFFMDPMVVGRFAYLPHQDFERRWVIYEGRFKDGKPRPGGVFLHHFGLAIWKRSLPHFNPSDLIRLD